MVPPMSAGAVSDTYHRIHIRIPGWLLVIVLALVVAWWAADKSGIGDDDNRALQFPARVTSLDSTFENRVLSATVLVEANERFEANSIGFTVILDDSSQLQAGAREVGAGAWHGRSYVFVIDRLIPEGRTPRYLQVSGKNGGASVSLPGGPPQ